MIALVGILLLCGFVLFLTGLIDGFFFYDPIRRAMLWLGSVGVCALLVIGFYVL